MQTQEHVKLLLPFLLAIIVTFLSAFFCYRAMAKKSDNNPHELKNLINNSSCALCHQEIPEHAPESHTRAVLPEGKRFSQGPVEMCRPCHEGSMESHPLDVYPRYAVPKDLPLASSGSITCLTCHYTHGSLKSDNPCCSVSFLDRLFGSDRMEKSFLLRRNNKDGGLCKACHEQY